jgi:hypothetical protein
MYSVLDTALQVGDTISTNTGTQTPSRQPWIGVAFSGLVSPSPLDYGWDLAGGNSGAASSGATATLAQADEIIIHAVGATQAAADTMTPGAGFVLESSNITPDGSNDKRVAIFSKVVSSTDATTPSVALSAAGTWGSGVLTAKLSTAPPPSGYAATLWDGSAEVPATVTLWDGAAEVPATLEIT